LFLQQFKAAKRLQKGFKAAKRLQKGQKGCKKGQCVMRVQWLEQGKRSDCLFTEDFHEYPPQKTGGWICS
jgi:hypothetical protein